jgi:hypothetical protein
MLSTQKSLRYLYDDLSDDLKNHAPQYDHSLYPHMFMQDVTVLMFPYDVKDHLSIVSEEQRHLKIFDIAFDRRSYDRVHGVSEFLREVAYRVIYAGKCVVEIVYGDEWEADKFSSFKLTIIPHYSIIEKWGKNIQYVPEKFRKDDQKQIELAGQNFVVFGERTAKQYDLSKLSKLLMEYSKYSLPEVYLQGQQKEKPVNVDMDIFNHTGTVDFLTITKKVGWDGRYFVDGKITDYFKVFRELQFGRFVLSLRDELLNNLNYSLQKVEQELDVKIQIENNSPFTIERINAAEKRLETQCNLREILREISWSHSKVYAD